MPGGDEARMRFLTDALGVKLVARQLPPDSRSFLRALLSARCRPLPAAWASAAGASEPAKGAMPAGAHQSQWDAQDSDARARGDSAAANGGEDDGKDAVPGVASKQPSFWPCIGHLPPPDSQPWLNGHATSTEWQLIREPAGPGQSAVNGLHCEHASAAVEILQDQSADTCAVAAAGHVAEAHVSAAAEPSALSYAALQGLMQSVSAALMHADPGPVDQRGAAVVDMVDQGASDALPPGL